MRRPAMALAAVGWLTACAPVATVAPPEVARPAAAPARTAPAAAADALSAELAAYYRRIENERRARGLMRTDSGADAMAISAGRLADLYAEIALRDEYLRTSRGFISRSSAANLRRWEEPVRFRLEFGASVPPGVRTADHGEVAALVRRMSSATRHPMRLLPPGTAEGGNFHVLVLSEAERRAIGPRLRALVPGIDPAAVRLVTDMPRETFCMVLAFSRRGDDAYTDAVAIIRAEHPDLTRLACYHEELAQGLGLANDSLLARPSVFNDNQEFALLTALDLLLLRLHYDPRLAPGMSDAEARPIVLRIAAELVGGES
jgi:hypothetical protein